MKEMWLEVIFQMQRLMAGLKRKIQLLAKLLWEPGRQHLLRTKSSLKRVENLHISLPLLRKIQ